MRKLIAIVAIVSVALVPSAAGAAKKKKPKPYKSETVSILASHPILHSYSEGNIVSVTAQEFMARCEIPATNGLDGAIYEIPAEYQKMNTSIEAIGSAPAGWDVDIYAFNSDCEITQALNSAGTDEAGSLLKGTAFVFVHNYLPPGPVDVHIELKPL